MWDFMVEYGLKVENGKDNCHELLFLNVFNAIFWVLKISKQVNQAYCISFLIAVLLTFLLANFSSALIFLFDITMTRTKCSAFKKRLQTEQFHQAFQLVFLLKKLKYLMCAFAFCNYFLWLIIGRHQLLLNTIS